MAARAADALDARAFVQGHDLVFAEGAYRPDLLSGRHLLAHELAHVMAQLPAGMTARKTKGEEVIDRAHSGWLDPNAAVKVDVDVLKAALREVAAGKSVTFNHTAGKTRITSALSTLGRSSDEAAAQADWDWLVQNRAAAATASYHTRQSGFLARFESPLAALTRVHPQSQTTYWLKNTPPQIMDAMIRVATASGLPPEELWAYAMKEGLDKYVRGEIGLGATDEPTAGQLAAVSTSKPLSGFDYLGSDDFFVDIHATREPASAYLPAGFNLAGVTPSTRVNEKGRSVSTVIYPDLETALQGMAALLRRRRALFLADAKAFGYAAPTVEEIVYWTYIYYNVGEFNGQLKKYAGKRRLSDWITAREYPNAIKLLESYRTVKVMAIF